MCVFSSFSHLPPTGRYSSGADRKFALLEDVFRKFPETPVSIEIKENNSQLIEKVQCKQKHMKQKPLNPNTAVSVMFLFTCLSLQFVSLFLRKCILPVSISFIFNSRSFQYLVLPYNDVAFHVLRSKTAIPAQCPHVCLGSRTFCF